MDVAGQPTGVVRLGEPLIDLRAAWRETSVISAIIVVVIVVAVLDRHPLAFAVAGVATIAAAIVAIAVTPAAARLTIDADGFELRTLLVLRRRIPWSAVGSIAVVEGWSGATVAIDLDGPAGEGTILGLAVDPTLGRRAFASTFGLEPAAFRDLLVARRDAAHP